MPQGRTAVEQIHDVLIRHIHQEIRVYAAALAKLAEEPTNRGMAVLVYDTFLKYGVYMKLREEVTGLSPVPFPDQIKAPDVDEWFYTHFAP